MGEGDVSEIDNWTDIWALFGLYNEKYFEGKLAATTIEWSDRMTLCAGICYARKQGNSRYCIIRLSRPLLQYRPYHDTLSTLLHEMIHAYLWIKTGQLDRNGHGVPFLTLADEINTAEIHNKVKITVYHGFHAEVVANRKHVWRCRGICRERPPFFGFVRRAMNRPPQPADWWWMDHSDSCGGKFEKIKGLGPVPKETKKTARKHPVERGVTGFVRRKPDLSQDNNATKDTQCPACGDRVANDLRILNSHLDDCLVDHWIIGLSAGNTLSTNDQLDVWTNDSQKKDLTTITEIIDLTT